MINEVTVKCVISAAKLLPYRCIFIQEYDNIYMALHGGAPLDVVPLGKCPNGPLPQMLLIGTFIIWLNTN